MMKRILTVAAAGLMLFPAIAQKTDTVPQKAESKPLFTKECLASVPENEFRQQVENTLRKTKEETAYRNRIVAELQEYKSDHAVPAAKRLEILNRLITLFERYLSEGSKECMLRVWCARKEMENLAEYFHWEEKLMKEKNSLPAPKVFSVKDFGAVGDGKNDDGPAIRKAIAAAQALNAPATVFFPNGKYRIVPGKRNPPITFAGRYHNITKRRKVQDGHINILRPEHLTLQGEKDVTLIMTDAAFSGIVIAAGYDTRLKDLSIDYDPLPYTQGKILKYEEEKDIVTVQIDPGYLPPDAPNIAKAAMWRLSLRQPGKNIYHGSVFPVLGCKAIDKDIYEIKIGSFSKIRQKRGIIPGMLFDIKGRRDHFGSVAVADHFSSMTTIENVWIYSSPSVAFHFMSMATVMYNSGVKRLPDSTRLVSSNADGIMCGSSITIVGPYVENCYFEFMGDDGLNSDSGTPKLTSIAEDGLTCRPMDAEVGDSVYVIDGTTGEIKAVANVIMKDGKKVFSPRLPADLSTRESLRVSGKVKPGDISSAYQHKKGKYPDLIILGRTLFGGTAVVNTSYKNIRGLGLQITSPSVSVENCTFDTLTGAGIAATALMNWGMYFSTHNTVIRGNKIRKALIGVRACCIPPYSKGKIEICSLFDLLIENNVIGPDVRTPFIIRNTYDAVVRNNTSTSEPKFEPDLNRNLIQENNIRK